MPPAGPLARVRRPRRPEPARAPLARAMQLHRIEPHLHPIARGVIGHIAPCREQCELTRLLPLLVKGLDDPRPSRVLAVVDLAQIQHGALDHPAASTAPVFDNAPVTVLLAVLLSPGESQEHAGYSTLNTACKKGVGLHYTRIRLVPLCVDSGFFNKITKSEAQLRKSG